MDLVQYFVQYLTELCEGSRPTPPGLILTGETEEARAVELQPQIQAIGVPGFVRLCAMAEGVEIPDTVFEDFSARQRGEAPVEAAPAEEPEPAQSEIRDIYEVFLDSVCLDDALVLYLIDILKRQDKEDFQKLSHAAARTILDMDDFLAWLGNKELLGDTEEQACVRILDGCFDRLLQEGRRELLAALLSGDEATFCAFRAEAPELVHLPDATYDWFCRYYLDRYYPMRVLLRSNGISFPTV